MTAVAAAWTAAALGGGLLALGYLAGLWWTVRRLPLSPRPGWLAAGSFLARAGGASAVFVMSAGGDAARLMIAVGAFLVVRYWVVSTMRAGLRTTRAQG